MPPAPMPRRPIVRLARFVLVTLLAFQALYLVAANVALRWDLLPMLIRRATHQKLQLHWDSAYSLWYGHVTVYGYRMQFDDTGSIQLDLTVDEATVDMALLKLASQHVTFDKIRARGVSYRMVTKVDVPTAKANPRRLAAFPVIEGPDFSAVKPLKGRSKLTPDEIDHLWKVALYDTQGELREIWIDEYRYLGPASVRGEFTFAPLNSVATGPDTLRFDGGALSVGPHLLAPHFAGALDLSISPVTGLDVSPMPVVNALSAALVSHVWLEDFSTLDLYRDDIELRGRALADIEVAIDQGKVTPSSTLGLKLEHFEVRTQGIVFTGHPTVQATVVEAAKIRVAALVSGELVTPPIGSKPVSAAITDTEVDLKLTTNDLAASPELEMLTVKLGEARIADASSLSQQVGKVVPLIAPAVLGNGPLTASVTATVTPQYQLVRLKQSKLGGASLEGAAVRTNGKWNGAVAGKFGVMPLGLELKDSQLGAQPFISGGWLASELEKAKIQPEGATGREGSR